MKKLKIFLYALVAALLLPFSSCKDEDAYPIPDFETAVHGYGKLTGSSAANFQLGDKSKIIESTFQWVSIDSKNTVTRIEFYLTFKESYKDAEGNPRTANHGTKLYKVVEGSAVPGNRTNLTIQVTQDDLYNLFKDAAFDYGDGNGSVQVFSDPDRTTEAPFNSSDNFRLNWALTTADGRYFDSWSDSICGEFETYHGTSANNGGFNCFYDWTVICVSDLAGTCDFVTTNMLKGDGAAGVPFPGTTTGEVTFTAVSPGVYDISDATFGQFAFAWNDDPATGVQMVDACNNISSRGADQYAEIYTFSFSNRNGSSITLTWSNDYGDAGVTVLTRQDGKNWPDLK